MASPVGNSAAEVWSEEPAGADSQTHGHPGRGVAGGCLETQFEAGEQDQASLSQKVLQSGGGGNVAELALGSWAAQGEGPLQPAFPSYPPPHTPR